jgi:predicted cobalt transporter CbtA
MLARSLLIRGMLIGVLAGLLAAGFASVFGEPQVQHAIDFESAMVAAAGDVPEPEIVSRAVQRSFGLLTAGMLAGVGIGGLFSLVFSFAYGRIGKIGPRNLAALLALAGFAAVVLIPGLKYPPNPPSVGSPETIGPRTALFFEMIIISLAAMTLAVLAAKRLSPRLGPWNASLVAAVVFAVVIVFVQMALPDVNEVPEKFPAVVLWRFRVASLGMQVVMWGTLGLGFGALAERLVNPSAAARRALSNAAL